jgi:hypothetical protein
MENTYNNIIAPKQDKQVELAHDFKQAPKQVERVFEIDRLSIADIVRRNEARKLALVDHYDPIAGIGCCGKRVERKVDYGDELNGTYLIPEAMDAELNTKPCTTADQWLQLRLRHDFEFWCATCATILNKVSGRKEHLILNRPQRRVLKALEKQRLADKPLRLILLKARQWGGSTLVQMYMAWIQMVLKTNWNSLICGHQHQTSSAIKNMYERTLRDYPENLTSNGKNPTLRPFDGNRNVRQLSSSESLVIASSAYSQDAARGYDIKMAHLSEVAFWPSTKLRSPDDVVRSISASIPLEPLTMIAMESTANGVGNFFHQEWLRAMSGKSDKTAIFVPWYEIEIYRMEVPDVHRLVDEMDVYEKWLWEERQCTLEMINWYHHKRREYVSQSLMAAEFPTTDIEAFTSTSRTVFSTEIIENVRHGTVMPLLRGDMVARGDKTLTGLDFVKNDSGDMEIWKRPEPSAHRNRYIAVVDVGGQSDSSDWSVIAVIDRHLDNAGGTLESRPEVVAQWRGHVHHDQLAWKAVQIAHYYNNALLVFESNTLECEGYLDQLNFEKIKKVYPNLYNRTTKGNELKFGFQTNRETKQSAIYNLIAYARDGSYIERDNKAVDEMACYEIAPNGKNYSARRGKHDDILMTRAIGLWLIEEMRVKEGRSRAINPSYFIKQGQFLL